MLRTYLIQVMTKVKDDWAYLPKSKKVRVNRLLIVDRKTVNGEKRVPRLDWNESNLDKK